VYETFFGLRAKPFQLNPDPDFFFGSRGHKRAMAYLEYGLHQGEGFIVITGEVGAGKTTLVRNLLRRIPSDTVSAAQIVSTQVDADDLLRLVAAGFGIEHAGTDKSTLLGRLEDHFRALNADGRRALLIVDEAQNLSLRAIEELRMLSNFQVGTRSLVQSFLVGQPEFREIMQRPEMRQLKQRVIASYHLGPLDAAETQAYVEHRLHHVGWKDDPFLAPEAFDRIHHHTAGVPRRINTLCDRVLLATFLAEAHRIEGKDIDEVAAELSDELGGPELGGPQPGVAASAAQDAAAIGWPGADDASRLSQLEDRVALLEASTSMTYGMLKKVLRALRAQRSVERDVS
jgi:putative secretion ATPase (PEP-CTERM system associated)